MRSAPRSVASRAAATAAEQQAYEQAVTMYTRNGLIRGTVCIYQATSPEAIRRHAANADLPADEIIEVADTVLVRPDPIPVKSCFRFACDPTRSRGEVPARHRRRSSDALHSWIWKPNPSDPLPALQPAGQLPLTATWAAAISAAAQRSL
jgi:hypothetical protein